MESYARIAPAGIRERTALRKAMHAADMEREYYAWLEQQYEKDPQSQVGAGMRDIVL